jgi:hypothetical protein
MPAEKPPNLIPALGLVAVTVKVTSIVLAVALTEAMLIVNCVCVIPLKENIKTKIPIPKIVKEDLITFFILIYY